MSPSCLKEINGRGEYPLWGNSPLPQEKSSPRELFMARPETPEEKSPHRGEFSWNATCLKNPPHSPGGVPLGEVFFFLSGKRAGKNPGRILKRAKVFCLEVALAIPLFMWGPLLHFKWTIRKGVPPPKKNCFPCTKTISRSGSSHLKPFENPSIASFSR